MTGESRQARHLAPGPPSHSTLLHSPSPLPLWMVIEYLCRNFPTILVHRPLCSASYKLDPESHVIPCWCPVFYKNHCLFLLSSPFLLFLTQTVLHVLVVWRNYVSPVLLQLRVTVSFLRSLVVALDRTAKEKKYADINLNRHDKYLTGFSSLRSEIHNGL